MKHIFFVLLFSSAAVLVKAQSLKGSAWLLKSVDNIETSKSKTVDENIKLWLQFDSDSVYSGKACTTYTGSFSTVNGKNLSMKKAAAQIPNCLGVATLQNEVLDLYVKATRYRVDADKLFIFTSDDHRLTFEKK